MSRTGKRTGRQNGWTQSRVCTFRNQHGIAAYRNGERAERGEVTLQQAAARLKVSPMSVLRLIRAGTIPAQQLCKGAPLGPKTRACGEARGGQGCQRQAQTAATQQSKSRNLCLLAA
jgi:hypothetical protein